MQTVNFQCGNCNNLMAVGAEYVGQQVRCPHCQAVVVAPAGDAPPPAPAPASAPFLSPTVNEQEDIFAPPEPSDDLFGRPEAPRVELPPMQTTLAADGPALPADAEPLGSTMTYSAPEPPAPAGAAALPAWMNPPASPAPPSDAPAEEPAGLAHGDALAPVIRRPRDGGGLFIGLVFIPLVSYAVLVTVLAGYLFYRVYQEAAPAAPPSPLETLPSFDPSDPDGSTHLKTDPRKLNRAANIDKATATAALPPNQIVQLGKKLRLGDLEIEPLNVDREVVSVMVHAGDKPQPCPYPSLVLTLKLRNVSDNVIFQPMDPYFDRRWEPKKGDAPPLTILEMPGKGKEQFLFGGPANYQPPPKSPEWVVRPERGADLGDTSRQILNPGEEKQFFVCTDGGVKPDDKGKDAAEAIDEYRGKLLWRVHLRRGLVVVNPRRYVPVSTVIGVEFTDEDYRKSS